MDASKQRGSIVLTKQNIDGQDYIRIEYTDNQTIALLLSQDKGIKQSGTEVHTYKHPLSSFRSSTPVTLPTLILITAGYIFVILNPNVNTCCRKAIWNYWNRSVTVPRQSRLTGFISVISWSITKDVTSTV